MGVAPIYPVPCKFACSLRHSSICVFSSLRGNRKVQKVQKSRRGREDCENPALEVAGHPRNFRPAKPDGVCREACHTPEKPSSVRRRRQPGRGHGRSPSRTDDVSVAGVLRRSGDHPPLARRRVLSHDVKAAPRSQATSRHAESVLSHANCQHRARRDCYSCDSC
jgi:hypothetical protein